MKIGDKVKIVRNRYFQFLEQGDIAVIKANYGAGLFGIEVEGRGDAYIPGIDDPLNDGYWAFFDDEIEVVA